MLFSIKKLNSIYLLYFNILSNFNGGFKHNDALFMPNFIIVFNIKNFFFCTAKSTTEQSCEAVKFSESNSSVCGFLEFN